MKFLKPHFWYTKNQRNGVFLLVIVIFILQVIIFTSPFSTNEKIDLEKTELLTFKKQLDSLKLVEIENRKPKIFPFNPNYITDFKGARLGMSLEEIDRLLAFRENNKFINSKKEFQNVTKVSDSLLNKIAPYFKFPDWVVKRNKQRKSENRISSYNKTHLNKKEIQLSTKDINLATVEDLKSINGIGPALSDRIIKYRSKLQGFSFLNQLYEVWGLEKEVADKVIAVFKIQQKPSIQRVNVNTVEFKELLKNPYINYQLCKKIFNYRDEVAELQTIAELKNIDGFPLDKYNRIVLYLVAE